MIRTTAYEFGCVLQTTSQFSERIVSEMKMNRRSVWTCFVGSMLALGVAWFLIRILHNESWKSEAVSKIESIWNEFRVLKEDKFPSTAWFEFQQAAQSQLIDVAHELENRIDPDDQTSIDLLRIARDFLPRVLEAGTDPKPQFEEQCAYLISRAREQETARQRNESQNTTHLEYVLMLLNGLLILGIGRVYLAR